MASRGCHAWNQSILTVIWNTCNTSHLPMPGISVPLVVPPLRHSDSWPLLPSPVSTHVALVAKPASHSPNTRQIAPTLLPKLPLKLARIAFSALSQAALGRPLSTHAVLKVVARVSVVPSVDAVALKLSKHLWQVSHLHSEQISY